MGSVLTNIGSEQQEFMNNVLSENQQSCISTVNSSANNNVVIVNGANIDGNFTGVSDNCFHRFELFNCITNGKFD